MWRGTWADRFSTTVVMLSICLSVTKQENLSGSVMFVTDTTTRQIYYLRMGVSQSKAIVLGQRSNPVGVAYDVSRRNLYWSDVNLKTINEHALGTTSLRVVRKLGPDSIVDGIAIDSECRLLFYTDAGRSLIAVMSLDGRYHAVIISRHLDKPRAIALHPSKGVMYWTDWGASAHIGTAEMDGSNERILIEFDGVAWPNGLTVDVTYSRIYWCEARAGVIESSTLDGRERKVVYVERGSHFFGIASLGKHLYYTDWRKRRIMKLDKTVVSPRSYPFGDNIFVKPNAIYIGVNRTGGLETSCSINNGECAQMCLLKKVGHRCACSDDIYILVDDINCLLIKRESNSSEPIGAWRMGTLNPDDALPEATTSGSTSTSDTTVIIETNSAAPNVKTSADTSPFETTTSPVVIEKSITVSYTTDAEPVTVMNPVALKASRQPAQGLLPSINTNTIATVDVAHVEPTTASPATSTRSSHAPRTAGHDVHVIDVTSAANDGILLADHATTEFEVAVKTSAKCVHGTYESTSPLTSTPSTTEDRSKPGFPGSLTSVWLTRVLIAALTTSVLIIVVLSVFVHKYRNACRARGRRQPDESAHRQTVRSSRSLGGTAGNNSAAGTVWNEFYTVNATYMADSGSFCNVDGHLAKGAGEKASNTELEDLFKRMA